MRHTCIVALCLFALINCGLSLFTPIHFNEFAYPYKGWAWWTINDLRQKPSVHNVALLGSSLMVSAISGTDANYLKSSLDLSHYHKASYLEHLLRTRFGGDFSVYNLAAPGQMPSDAYLALKAMVNCANRPDVVIYGIAPRDFIDSTLSSPSDTEPFKYLHRLVNIDDVSHKYFRSPLAKFEWWLKRSIYLYGKSLDFQMLANQCTTKILSVIVPQPYNNPPFTWWDRVRLLPAYLPGEIHPEAVMASPVDRKTAAASFEDLTKDYQDRYRSPDPKSYRTQIYFLKKLAAFCHKERIELVVVNMPITFYNASMLRPGIYTKYLEAMSKVCFESGISFHNLCNFGQYPQSEFHDCVHLNAFGGQRFFNNLVTVLRSDIKSASALSMAGKELERQRMLAQNKQQKWY